jgi:hypothetical protein
MAGDHSSCYTPKIPTKTLRSTKSYDAYQTNCGLVCFLRGKVCPTPRMQYKVKHFTVSLDNTVLNVVVTMASIIDHTEASTLRQSYKGKSTTLPSTLFTQMSVMNLMHVERAKSNLVEFHCITPC